MKYLRYLLGASILLSGVDLIISTNIYGCPRCRRALPKGPRKKPHPGFSNKQKNSATVSSETANTVPVSCSSSCCCAHKKMSSSHPFQENDTGIENE